MSKNIELDKFYTPKETAKKCIDIFWQTFFGVTEIIEPSAGNGSFSLQIPNCIAYDLEPEHESITKQDFLQLDLPYKQGRSFIGNPPFGDRNNLSRSFYKHACKMGDMIGFILPISQLDNTDSLYLFDLVKSVDLGNLEYSGMKVHCCFNLYHRPKSGKLNKKPKLKSDLFKLLRTGDLEFEQTKADFMFCKRGSVGKEILEEGKRYGDEYKVVVFDKSNLQYIKNTILGFDWQNYKKHQSSPNISKNDVYRLFKSEERKK
jgi:hypothetical protein